MSDDLARRQANVARLRKVLEEIEHTAAMSEASRFGRMAPAKAETPEAVLRKLESRASQPLPKLSPDALRRLGLTPDPEHYDHPMEASQ